MNNDQDNATIRLAKNSSCDLIMSVLRIRQSWMQRYPLNGGDTPANKHCKRLIFKGLFDKDKTYEYHWYRWIRHL